MVTRREFLVHSANGFGAVAFASLMAQAQGGDRPVGAAGDGERTHHAPRAKSVIFLYMDGGPSSRYVRPQAAVDPVQRPQSIGAIRRRAHAVQQQWHRDGEPLDI